MADNPSALDVAAALAETIDFLTIRREGDDAWVGDAPDWFGEYLFAYDPIIKGGMRCSGAPVLSSLTIDCRASGNLPLKMVMRLTLSYVDS